MDDADNAHPYSTERIAIQPTILLLLHSKSMKQQKIEKSSKYYTI